MSLEENKENTMTEDKAKVDPRLDNASWAGVLVQALPYFRHWVGKTIVVKYGGNAMLNEELKHGVMEDIVLLNTIGIHVVLVHGGGPEINNMLNKIGKESKFVNGLRYTDAETMEVVQMVLTGKLNKDIVGILLKEGARGRRKAARQPLHAQRLPGPDGPAQEHGRPGERHEHDPGHGRQGPQGREDRREGHGPPGGDHSLDDPGRAREPRDPQLQP